LKDIIRNREATGQFGKCVAELNEFVINFVHRSSIQSQALANFIVEWTLSSQEEATTSEEVVWTVFCDGSWGSFGDGGAAVIISPSKVKTSYAAKFQFQCTNNIA
jgi:hypothetical protein